MRRAISSAAIVSPPAISEIAAGSSNGFDFLRNIGPSLLMSNCLAVLNSREVARFIESRVRVRYAETDQMAIAHHASYIVWFEIGRTDLCRATGFTYREIENRGLILVVTEVTCRYRAPYH